MANRKYFDKLHEVWRHEVYHDMSPFHQNCKRLIAQFFAGSARPGLLILDVGCGIGDLMVTLSKQGVMVDGTDLALSALRFARNNLPQANLVLSDARWLPFRESRYGLVACSEVLEHIEDHAQATREINRVLAPGGVAVFTVPHGERHWTGDDRVDGHLRRYSRKQFADLVGGAGFDIDEIWCSGFPFAVLFRNTVFTPLFNRDFHRSISHVRHSLVFRVLLRLIVTLFRFDDLFHGSELGITLVAKVRKPLTAKAKTVQVR